MLQDETFFLILMLIPVVFAVAAGIIIHLTVKADKKAREKEIAAAKAEKTDSINHVMESMQEAISGIRETTDRIKKQTEEINALSQRLRNKSAEWNVAPISSPVTGNSLGKDVSCVQVRPPCPEDSAMVPQDTDRDSMGCPPNSRLPPGLFPPR